MRIFITAVAGTGMGSLAGLLKELGHEVAGSDVAFHPPMGPALQEWGVELHQGFDPRHLNGNAFNGERPEVVVVGNVCRKDNVEALASARLGIERLHIADALQRFALPGTSPLVVTGTHGKTTTSSLCAHLLQAAGLNPGFLIGGVPQSLGKSFSAPGKRKLATSGTRKGTRATPFVLEGDEYDTAFWEKTAKFLHYRADVAILTSIEHDHIDIYPTLEDYLSAFRKFVRTLPESGLLLAYAGDPQVVKIAKEASCEVAYYALQGEETYGVAPHWLAAPAETSPEGTTFDLFAGGVLVGRFINPLSGSHNLRNATAALGAAAHGYGVPLADLVQPLSSFQGVKRRQELLGSPREVAVYDDFAHHPTAVRETLSGLRAKHPRGKLIAIFEPRSATACRRLHQEAYQSAFDSATHVIVAPVGRPELPEEEKLHVPALIHALNQRKIGQKSLNAAYFTEIAAIVAHVTHLAEPGDTIAVLSNGPFGGIHEKLLEALAVAPHAATIEAAPSLNSTTSGENLT